MLIGISGKTKVGKDEAGKYLQQKIYNETNTLFTIVRFADALKDIVTILTEIPRTELESQFVKSANSNFTKSDTTDYYTYRELLQILGTDVLRKWDNDIWIKIIQNKYPYSNIIITDVRFPNELFFINRNGNSIRINRDFAPKLDHESEIALDDYDKYFDYIIDNNSSLDNFYLELDKIIPEIKRNIL